MSSDASEKKQDGLSDIEELFVRASRLQMDVSRSTTAINRELVALWNSVHALLQMNTELLLKLRDLGQVKEGTQNDT